MDSAESKPPTATGTSGKLVIIGIVFVAFWAAAIGWYFRYNATHQVVRFWGPETVVLIRDASQVTLHVTPINPGAAQASPVQTNIDVSQGRGLTHLRNALLEDHNFVWPAVDQIAVGGSLDWKWILEFRDPKEGRLAAIQFTKDCTLAARVMSSKERGSVRPTAIRTDLTTGKGLREMFAEFTAASSADGGAKPQATNEAAEPAR